MNSLGLSVVWKNNTCLCLDRHTTEDLLTREEKLAGVIRAIRESTNVTTLRRVGFNGKGTCAQTRRVMSGVG